MAFLFYKDGIGEISVKSSVSTDELERFVDIVKDEVQSYRRQEDVVTKLWAADFENISYKVLDEYLMDEFGDGRRNEREGETPLETEDHTDLPSFFDKGRVIVHEGDTIDPIHEYVMTFVDQSEVESEQAKQELFESMMDSFFAISSEELRLCQAEFREENKQDKLVCFLGEILDFTLVEGNSSAVLDVSNVIERIADHIVAEGNTSTLADLLERLRTFVGEHSIPEDVETFFINLEGRITDTSLLLTLGKRIGTWNEEASDVLRFYRLVGKRAVPTLCTLLDGFNGKRLHKEACDTLLAIAKDDIPQIIEALDMDKPGIAYDVAYLIRAQESDEIPAMVRQLVHYPDQQVQEQIIQFLVDVGSPDAAIFLVDLLEDADKHIRVKILSAIEKMPHAIVRNKLLVMAFDKELDRRDSDEQEYIFRALGKLAGEEALPKLKHMLEKKNPLARVFGKKKHIKTLALRALEHINSPESMILLSGLAEDSDRLIKSKAQRALVALQELPPQGNGADMENGISDDMDHGDEDKDDMPNNGSDGTDDESDIVDGKNGSDDEDNVAGDHEQSGR